MRQLGALMSLAAAVILMWQAMRSQPDGGLPFSWFNAQSNAQSGDETLTPAEQEAVRNAGRSLERLNSQPTPMPTQPPLTQSQPSQPQQPTRPANPPTGPQAPAARPADPQPPVPAAW